MMDIEPAQSHGARPPLHEIILGQLKGHIVSGEWPPGTRIPSEIELTEQFACSRMTVNKALTRLASTGLIERRRKAGSFVAAARARSAILQIPDIHSEVEALGLTYRHEVTARAERKLLSVEEPLLDLDAGSPILALTTVHFGGDQPFGFEDRLINLKEVPGASGSSFTEMTPGAWLVATVPFTDGEHRIRAEGADERAAKLLGVKRGTACLIIERRTWRSGQPITWVRIVYPGEKQEMIARFQPA